MATPQENLARLQEISNRGLEDQLPQEHRARFDEAVRRGLVTRQEGKRFGLLDTVTGSERIAATPELGTLPEFAVTPEGDTFKISMGLLSTFDPKAQQDIIQESIPEAVFEQVNGSTIIEVPTEEGGVRRSVLNRPGFSPQDLTTTTAQALAFFPAAKLANLGKNLLQKVGIGAAGAGATEAALQEGGVLAGRQERSPTDVAIAAGTGGLSEVVVPAFQGAREAVRSRLVSAQAEHIASVTPAIQAVKQAQEGLQEATGKTVGVFQAQQTQDAAELITQRVIPQLSAGSQTAATALSKQNKEAFELTAALLDTVAPQRVTETGAKRFVKAAERARQVRVDARSQAASPLYKEAFRLQRESGQLIDVSSVQSKIAGIIGDTVEDGQVNSTMKKISGQIASAGGDLKRLQSAKNEIDNLIEGQGDKLLGRVTRGQLTEVQKDLVEALVDQSKPYEAARAEFIRLSPAVEAFDESLLGRISKLPDDQLETVSSKIFDPKTVNPTIVRNAKQVIEDVDPGAWNDILRVEAEGRFGALGDLIEDQGLDVSTGNLPGQIKRAMFGNIKKRKAFLAGMNEEQKQNFKWFETVMNRAASGRAAGSPTTPFKEAISKLRGVPGIIRDTILNPKGTLQGAGEASLFDRRVSSIAKVMFDPQWRPQMLELLDLDSNTPAAARAFTQLIDEVGRTEEGDQ